MRDDPEKVANVSLLEEKVRILAFGNTMLSHALREVTHELEVRIRAEFHRGLITHERFNHDMQTVGLAKMLLDEKAPQLRG